MTLVEDYLARLGVPRPREADASALRTLHAAHLRRIPFENLDVAAGRPASLALADLADKVLHRGRGGFCYELNGLFAHLLDDLGYDVTLLAGRVWTGERFGPPLDHLALRVTDAAGGRWLVDVGFGRHTRHPLRWVLGDDQDDPNGRFRLDGGDDGDEGDDDRQDVVVHNATAPQYRLEPHPRDLADFAAMCWYQQHSPDSHFTSTTICSRETPTGRVTLSENTLTITDAGTTTRTDLSDPEVLAAYREHFGLALDAVPRLAGR